MDFWTIIGIVSSILGIISFLKNDAVSLPVFLKKILGCELLSKKQHFVFFLGQNPLKKI